MIASLFTTLAADDRGAIEKFFLKPAISEFGEWTDPAFMYIMWVCIVFFVGLMGIMFYWAWRWRRRPGHVQIRTPNHNTLLEVTWIVVPLIIITVMFFWGFHGYMHSQVAASNAEIVNITGQRWFWTATYANGASSQESVFSDYEKTGDNVERRGNQGMPVIVTPAGRAVKFLMTSTDVIHSFYIPDARIKIDVFPNRYTSMTLTPRAEGLSDQAGSLLPPRTGPGSDHYVFCAEYCGQNHSEMAAILRVLPEADFQAKIKEWADFEVNYENEKGERPEKLAADKQLLQLWQLGEKLHSAAGCAQCHTVDGSKGTGPSWKGSYGTPVKFADGGTLSPAMYNAPDMETAWANYIRESIKNPSAHLHEGFANQMPPYPQLSDKAVLGIIAYFRHLNGLDYRVNSQGGPAGPGGAPAPAPAPPKPQ